MKVKKAEELYIIVKCIIIRGTLCVKKQLLYTYYKSVNSKDPAGIVPF